MATESFLFGCVMKNNLISNIQKISIFYNPDITGVASLVQNIQNSSDMLFDKYNSASICGKRNICRRNKIHSVSR